MHITDGYDSVLLSQTSCGRLGLLAMHHLRKLADVALHSGGVWRNESVRMPHCGG